MSEMRRIATIGCFDGVHLGHRALLRQLRSEAEARGMQPLVVTFSDHPLRLIAPDKAPARLMPIDARRDALRDASGGDVLMLDFTPDLRRLTATEFLDMLHREYGVDTLLRGFNHKFGSDRLTEPEEYIEAGRRAGVEVINANELKIPDIPAVSSSAVRRVLAEGRVDVASTMLGRPYAISGTVVGGHRVGRSIGFPTANIRPADPRQLVPADGVYAVDVKLPDGTMRRGMLNIGTRPTMDYATAERTIEVNILDYNADLYGAELELKFLARLRSEQRFDTLDDLIAQLTRDRLATLKISSANYAAGF